MPFWTQRLWPAVGDPAGDHEHRPDGDSALCEPLPRLVDRRLHEWVAVPSYCSPWTGYLVGLISVKRDMTSATAELARGFNED